MAGFLSCPWCCCSAADGVGEPEKPACCAKKDSAPTPDSDEDDDVPDHECSCAKDKDAVTQDAAVLPANLIEDIQIGFPLVLKAPERDWIEPSDELVLDPDISPPPPIRQMFCVLRL